MIPYGRQDISEADIAAVVATLTSDYITQGPAITAFEAELGKVSAASEVIAASSATAALHIACLALDLGPGDTLWTVPNTFVASANVGLYCGADVDFVDIDPTTYTMCPDALEARLIAAERDGTLPKVVIPVHFAGQSCDMARIGALRDTYGFRIIEDASHAIGGSYGNGPVGNCAHSDICVFSFHPVKIVTTAEGGAATTQDAELAERMRLFRSHGITRDPNLMTGTVDEGPWVYEQTHLGYNYRITDIQAALGTSQLQRLTGFIDTRHRIAARYDAALADLPLTLPYQPEWQRSALHLYPILIGDEAPLNRTATFTALREAGIGVNVLYIPVHRQPFYAARGHKAGDFPNAEDYYSRTIAIPMYATLSDNDQGTVIKTLQNLLG